MSDAEDLANRLRIFAEQTDIEELWMSQQCLGEAAAVLSGCMPDAFDDSAHPLFLLDKARQQITEVQDSLGRARSLLLAASVEIAGGDTGGDASDTVLPASGCPIENSESSEAQPSTNTAKQPRKPKTWDGLRQKMNAMLPDNFNYATDKLTTEQAKAAYATVAELDDKALEDARSFALDEVARYVSAEFRQPCEGDGEAGLTKLDKAVEDTAQRLAQRFLKISDYRRDGRGLAIGDLGVDAIESSTGSFRQITAAAIARLPNDQRLLSDILVTIEDDRASYHGTGKPPLDHPKRTVRRICEGTSTNDNIDTNLFGGVRALYHTAFWQQHAAKVSSGLMGRQSQYLQELFSDDELTKIAPRQTANAAAALHITVFNAAIQQIAMLKDGVLQFERTNIPSLEQAKTESTHPPRKRLYDKPYGCPALRDETLIDTMRATYPKIILQTQKIVAEAQAAGNYW